MVDLVALTQAFADTLSAIPELMAALHNDPAAIVPYFDIYPDENNSRNAVYEAKPGCILIMWDETLMVGQGEMPMWTHRYKFYVRPQRAQSALALIVLVINGIPNPGDGLRWRFCPVMPGVLPTNIVDVTREPDEQGVDYYAILSETNETGDA